MGLMEFIPFKLLSKVVLGIVALVLLVPILGGLMLGVGLSIGSKRTVYERSLSPNGNREARVQFDDCGAACGFDRIVFVKRSWLNDQPLLSCRAFLAEGEEPITLTWIDNQHLVIRHGFRPQDITAVASHCCDVTIDVQPDAGLLN